MNKELMKIVSIGERKTKKDGTLSPYIGVIIGNGDGLVETSVGNVLQFGDKTGLLVFEYASFKGKLQQVLPPSEFEWTDELKPMTQEDIDKGRTPLTIIAVNKRNSVGKLK